MVKEKFVRYVSEGDPFYQEKKEKNTTNLSGRAFGEWEVDSYKRHREGLELENPFDFERKYLVSYLKDKYHSENYFQLFEEALREPALKERLISLRGVAEGDFTPEIISDLLEGGAIDDELLLGIFENHIKIFKIKEAEFKERADDFKKDFTREAVKLIDDGYLTLSQDDLARRIEDTPIILTDGVNDKYASYRDWVVRISTTVKEQDQRHAVFHELVHAVVGGRILKETKFEGFESGNLIETKSGLSIKTKFERTGGLSKRKFNALNEAVTEEIAIKLSGSGGSYVEERFNLLKLINENGAGIPEEVFIEAYCENFDPENPHRMPAWKRLILELKKAKKEYPNLINFEISGNF